MPQDLKLQLRLTADGKGFVGEIRATADELDKLRGVTGQVSATTDKLDTATSKAGRTFTAVHKKAALYGGVLVVANQALAAGLPLIARTIRSVPRLADAWTDLNNRLRLVTKSETELIGARNDLLAISRRTRTELSSNAQLYSRLALAADNSSGRWRRSISI